MKILFAVAVEEVLAETKMADSEKPARDECASSLSICDGSGSLLMSVDRDLVRQGNNQLIAVADALWALGPISDGVLFEIIRARHPHKPVQFFSIATHSAGQGRRQSCAASRNAAA